MKKYARQRKVLELIESYEIETQEELADYLNKSGIEITQATISRDIKELKLIKVLSDTGRYKYATISHTENVLSNKLINIFSQTVTGVENVNNFVIVKTLSGSAPAAAEAIDSLNFFGIAGTLAGDNTIFVMARDDEKAQNITQRMKKMISG